MQIKNYIKFRHIATLIIAIAALFTACDNANPVHSGEGLTDLPNKLTKTAIQKFDVEVLTEDTGVVINGIKWATRNVYAPGTFALTPEAPGMFYQWNEKTAWSATDPAEGISMPGWNAAVPPNGKEWTKTNDPSPAGWRIPTLDEIKSLLDTAKVDKTWNDTKQGFTFTDRESGNSLFLPAAGYRSTSDGTLVGAGVYGNYWCSAQAAKNYAFTLYFNADDAVCEQYYRRFGFSVRAVADGG